jgi:ferredoxin-NADP reductase
MAAYDGEVKMLERITETPSKRSYLFERPSGFNFQPGQFVIIQLMNFPGSRKDSLRQFSISSGPLDNYIAISTQVIGRDSLFKDTLDSLKRGDPVFLSGPNGSFTLDSSSRSVVMIAGGVGVTPFRSMIRYLSGASFSGEVRLIHSSKTRDEILFYDEIERVKSISGWLKTYRFLTREEKDLAGFTRGRINSWRLLEILRSHIPDEVLISGPPSFVEGINDMLVKELKLDAGIIKTERFFGY